MVSLGSTTATRRCQGVGDGVAGAECPRVATLAIDVSEAHLWCRCAPPQPPDALKPENKRGGWGSMPQGCDAGH